jgi:hypothetical protein
MKRMRRTLAVIAFCFWSISLLAQTGPSSSSAEWKFAVSGDSRNCGDVVMPAIAAGVARDGASFYWHLGDFRALYDFDQDFKQRRERETGKPLTISDYQNSAWQDFIENQLGPFGRIPVFLGIGNHELVAPKTRADYLAQFADWLETPSIRDQRLKDEPNDHRLKSYYHWQEGGIDFITLDNASTDQFDPAQIRWFESVLARDRSNSEIHAVVVGMHAALPDSIASGHSMNDWTLGEQSGRRVYADLLKFRTETKKNVYVLASHSHFYMAGIFDTEYWRAHGGVLPGWIVGTAGAFRYALPLDHKKAKAAETNVYGYLLGITHPDGNIDFEFHQVREADVPAETVQKLTAAAVKECFDGNGATKQ